MCLCAIAWIPHNKQLIYQHLSTDCVEMMSTSVQTLVHDFQSVHLCKLVIFSSILFSLNIGHDFHFLNCLQLCALVIHHNLFYQYHFILTIDQDCLHLHFEHLARWLSIIIFFTNIIVIDHWPKLSPSSFWIPLCADYLSSSFSPI